MADQPDESTMRPDDDGPAMDRLRDEIMAVDGVLRRIAEEARTLAATLFPRDKFDLDAPHGWRDLSEAVSRLRGSRATDPNALLHLQNRVVAWQRAQKRLTYLCGTRPVWNT